MAHTWTHIEDYRSGDVLAHDELSALAQVWIEQRERLIERQSYRDFEEKLLREWSIETGLIERLYALDRGITQLLIEHGLRSHLIPNTNGSNPETTIAMVSDHKSAVESVFSFVKDERSLSTSYIKELHGLITKTQTHVEGIDTLGIKRRYPLLHGEYKKLPNNPRRPDGSVHEYCPPEHVASEMDSLLEMHHSHAEVAPEVEAAWLHHRFTQIHPFQDGNGRVARTLATLVFIKAGLLPLVIRDRDRAEYIKALEDADAGNLKPLINLFARQQRRKLIDAISIADDVIKSRKVKDAIEHAGRQLSLRRDTLIAEWESVKDTADMLRSYAEGRLKEVANDLQREMIGVLDNCNFFADGAAAEDERSGYWRYQIIQTARELEYYANTQTYRAWVRLVMPGTNTSELLISFHGLGFTFRGILACSAAWFQRVETEDGKREVRLIKSASDSMFQVNYKESPEAARTRFKDWLEDAILVGIRFWQATAM